MIIEGRTSVLFMLLNPPIITLEHRELWGDGKDKRGRNNRNKQLRIPGQTFNRKYFILYLCTLHAGANKQKKIEIDYFILQKN